MNLTGVFLCSRAFSKVMVQQKEGKIINIASLKGQEGCAEQVNYSASKAGVIGLTKALAKELGKFNISVNAVCSGFIVTDLNKHYTNKIKIAQKRSLLQIDNMTNNIVDFILYMSSNRFDNISGRIFNLDSRLL